MKVKATSRSLKSIVNERLRPTTKNLRNFLVWFLLIPGLSGILHSQMNYWVMPPFSFDVTQTPAGINPLYVTAPASGAYDVSNGAYDLNGNLLFYVENLDIRKPDGSMVGQIGGSTYHIWWQKLGGEIVIVPKPGECKKFYLIYSCGQEVLYTIVDCSGASIQLFKDTGGFGFPVGQFNYVGTGLAASKKIANPLGQGFIYYLYMVNSGSVYYSIIGASAISNATQIYTSGMITPFQDPSDYNFYPLAATELELSENGDYLAYNGVDAHTSQYKILNSGNVEVIELLNPTTVGSTWLYNSPNTIMNGLEFMGSSAPVLFVAGDKYFTQTGPSILGVLDKFDFLNNSTTPLITNSSFAYQGSLLIAIATEQNSAIPRYRIIASKKFERFISS